MLLVAVLVLVLAVVKAAPTNRSEAPGLLLTLFVLMVLWIGYGTLLESSVWQATLVKRLLGLRVYNSDGGRLTPMQAAGRNFLKDAPFLFLSHLPSGRLLSLLLVGAHVFVVQRSETCQAIHDRLASTWVAAPEEMIRLHLT